MVAEIQIIEGWCQALIKKRRSKELRSALRTLSPLEREVIETHHFGKRSVTRLAEVNRQFVLERAYIKLEAYFKQSKVKALEDRRKHEEQAISERVRTV